jgi:hypothetical protein
MSISLYSSLHVQSVPVPATMSISLYSSLHASTVYSNIFHLTNIDDHFAGRHCGRQKQPLCSEGHTQLSNQRNKPLFVRIWACIAVHLNTGAGIFTFVVCWK